MQRKIRVLVGKPGLDGHDRGAKVVAAALRDAGMEVIYTGLHQSPEQIVEAAVQEDVDVVALSILSGAHMTLFPEVLELMRRRGIGDRLLTGGGIIPQDDMDTLAEMGVGRLFGPGTSTQDIAVYIREWFDAEHGEPHDVALQAPAARPASRPAPKRAAPSVAKRAKSSAPKRAKRRRPAASPRKTAGRVRPKRSAPKRARARRSRS
jgi:methylmalonyl-CoA mutase C-terminal domain/subunit